MQLQTPNISGFILPILMSHHWLLLQSKPVVLWPHNRLCLSDFSPSFIHRQMLGDISLMPGMTFDTGGKCSHHGASPATGCRGDSHNVLPLAVPDV